MFLLWKYIRHCRTGGPLFRDLWFEYYADLLSFCIWIQTIYKFILLMQVPTVRPTWMTAAVILGARKGVRTCWIASSVIVNRESSEITVRYVETVGCVCVCVYAGWEVDFPWFLIFREEITIPTVWPCSWYLICRAGPITLLTSSGQNETINIIGFLPDTKIAGCACAGNARSVFPATAG